MHAQYGICVSLDVLIIDALAIFTSFCHDGHRYSHSTVSRRLEPGTCSQDSQGLEPNAAALAM